ncbi:MAG TPA: hypothetical protein VI643_01985, partial [Planctomycetota bacterium]|nr:hypothetical protein [Planctomycetota bacterium]
PGPGAASEPDPADPVPDFRLTAKLSKSRIVFRDAAGETLVSDLEASVDIPSVGSTSTASISFVLPDGGRGKASASFRVDNLTGSGTWELEAPSLKAFRAAAGVFVPGVTSLEGRVSGSGDLTVESFPSVKGKGSFTVEGIKATGRAPFELPRAKLTETIDIDGKGNGSAKLSAVLADAANVEIAVSFKRVESGRLSAEGTARATATLEELSRRMPGVLMLPEGTRLSGAIACDATFGAILEAWKPITARASVSATSDRVEMTSAGEKVGGPALFRAEAALGEEGRLELSGIEAKFGPVEISGAVELVGFDSIGKGSALRVTYRPAELGKLLAPWLGPVKLTGNEPRQFTLRAEGTLSKEGVLAEAKGAFGRLVAEGFETDADLTAAIEGGAVGVSGLATINGGKAEVTATFGGEGAAVFAADASGVQLNAKNGNVLALVHPIFHNAGRIDGTMSARLRFESTDPLDASKLAGGGSLEIERFVATGSGFMQALLAEMGYDNAVVEGTLKLPDLKVADGVVSYERMEMKLENTVMRFRGRITFDGKLDLVMTAPLRKSWMKKLGLDEEADLENRDITVPIRGTLDSPRFDFKSPLKKILDEALKRRLERELKKRLERKPDR